jgi:hypothetical protein
VLADQILEQQLRIGAAILRRMRVDHCLIQQAAIRIKHRHLASSTQPRVDRQDNLLGDWWLKQEAA